MPMITFLRLTQVLVAIITVSSLPLAIFFRESMLIIWVPMILLIVALNKMINAVKNNSALSPRLWHTYIVTAVFMGIICGFLVYFVGGFSSLGSDPEPTSEAYALVFVIALLYTGALIR